MLFNSYVFIFLFLPIAFFGFFALARLTHLGAAAWLTLASLFFYAWWSPAYLWLLVGSIAFNFLCGRAIALDVAAGRRSRAKLALGGAIAADLLLLGSYKYANFFLDTLIAATGGSLTLPEIVLPIGISFFTFTQIAYLADAYQGKVQEYNPVHYALFVSYFPHLIAGPVLHHAEMMPQFARATTYRLQAENVAVGITIFAVGLFKKVMLADPVGGYAKPVFDAASAGVPLTFLEGWCGALAYTLQIYFDFSGYSDMAIGLSRMFGVILPLNFDSPYKATSIIDFWRRWHMTLSRFLRDYLYIPLGGNRHGVARRYVNLFVTMLLGGLWHGAGWTFVLWGGLHGLYLAVNHGWRAARAGLGLRAARSTRAGRVLAAALTFLAVVAAWVLFRASDLRSALAMLRAMAGLEGLALPSDAPGEALAWIAGLLAIVWLAPNTQEIMAAFRPGLGMEGAPVGRFAWRPRPALAVIVAVMTIASIFHLSRQSEFLYFQF